MHETDARRGKRSHGPRQFGAPFPARPRAVWCVARWFLLTFSAFPRLFFSLFLAFCRWLVAGLLRLRMGCEPTRARATRAPPCPIFESAPPKRGPAKRGHTLAEYPPKTRTRRLRRARAKKVPCHSRRVSAQEVQTQLSAQGTRHGSASARTDAFRMELALGDEHPQLE